MEKDFSSPDGDFGAETNTCWCSACDCSLEISLVISELIIFASLMISVSHTFRPYEVANLKICELHDIKNNFQAIIKVFKRKISTKLSLQRWRNNFTCEKKDLRMTIGRADKSSLEV